MYRTLGKTGVEVSNIGYGCMRFEVIGGDNSKIDEPKAIQLIRQAIDRGINYLDTAYPYHGGNSEPLVAKALKDGYRDKVHIATKLPSWLVKTREDMDKLLNEQLVNLETDSIDFYLIHALNRDSFDHLTKLGLLEWMDEIKRKGLIKHIGFSFHDDLVTFKTIVDAYDWEFVQIQLNIVDTNHQQGIEGMYYAREKGMGIIVMEPLRGGTLANADALPKEVLDLYGDRSPVDWALKYLLDLDAVDLILSGMNQLSQIEENIAIAKEAKVGGLTESDKEVIGSVQRIFNEKILVACTACQYCMPCPHGVDIPGNFKLYNDSSMLDFNKSKEEYKKFFSEKERASNCQECGACEPLCPQHISIIKELKETAKTLEA